MDLLTSVWRCNATVPGEGYAEALISYVDGRGYCMLLKLPGRACLWSEESSSWEREGDSDTRREVISWQALSSDASSVVLPEPAGPGKRIPVLSCWDLFKRNTFRRALGPVKLVVRASPSGLMQPEEVRFETMDGGEDIVLTAFDVKQMAVDMSSIPRPERYG